MTAFLIGKTIQDLYPMPPCAASNGGITLLLQSTRLVAAVAILGR